MKGWSYPSQTGKMHYFADETNTSLCGSCWIINPNPEWFYTTAPEEFKCKRCARLLAKEQKQ